MILIVCRGYRHSKLRDLIFNRESDHNDKLLLLQILWEWISKVRLFWNKGDNNFKFNWIRPNSTQHDAMGVLDYSHSALKDERFYLPILSHATIVLFDREACLGMLQRLIFNMYLISRIEFLNSCAWKLEPLSLVSDVIAFYFRFIFLQYIELAPVWYQSLVFCPNVGMFDVGAVCYCR